MKIVLLRIDADDDDGGDDDDVTLLMVELRCDAASKPLDNLSISAPN